MVGWLIASENRYIQSVEILAQLTFQLPLYLLYAFRTLRDARDALVRLEQVGKLLHCLHTATSVDTRSKEKFYVQIASVLLRHTFYLVFALEAAPKRSLPKCSQPHGTPARGCIRSDKPTPLLNQGHIEQSSCNQVLPLLLHSTLKTHSHFKQLPCNHILNNMIKIDGTKRHNRSVSLDKPLQSRDATETTTDSVHTWLLESRWSYRTELLV